MKRVFLVARDEQLGEKHMRVYGLHLPIKSLGWLAGVICFALAAFFPPFSGFTPNGAMYFEGSASWWQTGGVAWQVLWYVRWQHFALSSLPVKMLIAQFAPLCFVPAVLPLCVWVLWRRLVDYAPRTSIARGVGAMLCALCVSLVLIFLLDELGGRVVLYTTPLSYIANLEIRGLMAESWNTSFSQTCLLALPCLCIGGILAWRQSRLEGPTGFARVIQPPPLPSQEN